MKTLTCRLRARHRLSHASNPTRPTKRRKNAVDEHNETKRREKKWNNVWVFQWKTWFTRAMHSIYLLLLLFHILFVILLVGRIFSGARERANKRTKQKEMEKKETKKKRTQNEEHRRVRFRLWSLAFALHIPTARNMRPPMEMKKGRRRRSGDPEAHLCDHRAVQKTPQNVRAMKMMLKNIYLYKMYVRKYKCLYARAHAAHSHMLSANETRNKTTTPKSKWNQMEYLADGVEWIVFERKREKSENQINNKYKDLKVRIRETRK